MTGYRYQRHIIWDDADLEEFYTTFYKFVSLRWNIIDFSVSNNKNPLLCAYQFKFNLPMFCNDLLLNGGSKIEYSMTANEHTTEIDWKTIWLRNHTNYNISEGINEKEKH